jgi:hypothetical protein
MTGLTEKALRNFSQCDGKERIGAKKYLKFKAVKAVAVSFYKGNNMPDLFFVGRGKNFSFFSAALIFWLLFHQGKSDKNKIEKRMPIA